ncbi:chromate transporter [Natranaerovirga hydrolytica]|uniref:Chromate transporter n=1 Tax=Natranaerovirga hydrolytica TaxID=680378 RepID=A0A4R1MHM3_9FIRM|nr:chromate transporter [Natranaerovirga hydrolytica]TCK90634.1 chromate transporter [Natranaerovirga hydrolytica]
MNKLKIFIQIYKTFFIVGILTIGGGIAMLPIIEKEIIEKRKWATDEEVMEAYSLAQSLPGVIAANTAVFLGYKFKKVLGSVAAVLGVISPSIIIIIMISSVLTQLSDYEIIDKAFNGIRVAVLAILVVAVSRMIKNAIKDYYTLTIAIVSFLLVTGSVVSPIIVIVVSAVLGILIYHRRLK